MSTDPNKLVRTIILADFLGCMFFLGAMSMTFSVIPVVVFTLLSIMLFISGALSLHQQYKKYKIRIYKFLELFNYGFTILFIVLAIASQI